jgi:hypothetical protein
MQFKTDYSLLFLFVSAIISCCLSYWVYRNNPLKLQKKWMVYVLMILRGMGLFIICFLLLEPIIKWLNQQKEKPILVIAVDNSESMLLGNNARFLKTEFTQALADFKSDLSEQYTIVNYTLGSEVKISDSLTFSEKLSNLSEGLEEIENNHFQLNHAATVLISDGMYNAGSNPAYAMSKAAQPIYTIGMGDTTQKKDVVVKKVYAPNEVFADNSFEIKLDLQAFYCPQEELKIEVREKEKLIYTGSQTVKGNKYFNQHIFTLNKASEGIHTYEISILPLQGEASYVNNKVIVQINSLRNKQNIVLVYQNIHPDIGAIERALSKQANYRFESHPINQIKAEKLPEAALYILHQVPGNQGEGIQIIQQLRDKNSPVFFIVGKQTGLSYFNQFSRCKIAGSAQNLNEAQAWVNNQFNLFQIDEASIAAIQKFNPLYTPYGNYQLFAETQALLYQQIGYVKTNSPLLAFSSANGANHSYLMGEGIWRWFLQDFLVHGNKQISENLLLKIIQWTAGKSDKSKFRLNPTKKVYDENEKIVFEATLFNDLFEKINTPEIAIQLRSEKGKEFNFQFGKVANDYQLQIGSLEPGKYTYIGKVANGNFPNKKGEIIIKNIQLESLQTRANFETLRAISQESGGAFYYANELNTLKENLQKNPNSKTVIHEQEQLKLLLEYKMLFVLLLLIFGTEWFIRKWQGSI